MTKQEKEQCVFETFTRLSGVAFDRFQFGQPPDEPDIVAWRGSERFGIEITSFYRRSERAREGEENLTLERAQRIYESRGKPFVDVCVDWAFDHPITKREREHVSHELATLVEQNLPSEGNEVELDWARLPTGLVSFCYSIQIERTDRFDQNHWYSSRGGFVLDWEPHLIQTEIDRKNPKPSKYRDGFSEIWLLLVSESGMPSSWLEMTDRACSTFYKSAFKRVFLLSSSPIKVFELHVSQ